MTNEEIAHILEEIAELLEILGEDPFKAKAYMKVAGVIRSTKETVEEIVKEGRASEIPGVGKGIAQKLEELVTTGSLAYYDELTQRIPASILSLTEIQGIGPKTAKLLFETLGITNREGLALAIREGTLKKVKGLGAKTEQAISKGLEFSTEFEDKLLLSEAEPIANALILELKKIPSVKDAYICGSLRRMKETVKDIDLLIVGSNFDEIFTTLKNNPDTTEVISMSKNNMKFRYKKHFKVDLYITEEEAAGAALVFHTGSAEHHERLRSIASGMDYELNEHGLYEKVSQKRIAGSTEEEVYRALGLQYVLPLLRENRGEIEVAIKNGLPHLIKEDDILSDLHVHSTWSDSSATLEEIAEMAIVMGYQYIAVTDHAKRLKIAQGMEEEEMIKRIEDVRRLNTHFGGKFKILAGVELNIDKDGLLDYPDQFLKKFDFVIASVHWAFSDDVEKMTKRILTAMENPYVHAIGHPSGRLLLRRPPYGLSYHEVFRKAAATNTALEINAFPDRLDLDDVRVKEAAEIYGVKFVLGTDAHALRHLSFMKYGIAVAQRGWLTKDSVLNTLNVEDFLKAIKK